MELAGARYRDTQSRLIIAAVLTDCIPCSTSGPAIVRRPGYRAGIGSEPLNRLAEQLRQTAVSVVQLHFANGSWNAADTECSDTLLTK